jgi:hypothetical protein
MLVEESRGLASCEDPQLLLNDAVDTNTGKSRRGLECLQTG